jgi:uncharacterized membrane protein YgdD (TMEM256/DUF423 family)|tara:strand:- start:73 stop:465 length:393 start_codon:yes stop_codon:yes gene_type:complete
MSKFIKVSILFCVVSVILGAFGAHLLKDLLSETELSSFKTGIRYQMFHGLAILILSLNSNKFTSKLKTSLLLMSIGTVLFSFSIYFLSIDDLLSFSMKFLGPITPIGGTILITSWIYLLLNVKNNDTTHI